MKNKHSFREATFKLTLVYVAMFMALSLGCSIWLYNVAAREVQTILSGSDKTSEVSIVEDSSISTAQDPRVSVHLSNERIIRDLIFFNLSVFGFGTLLSYILAYRTLLPIQKNYQLQEEFASNASHELRTPLTALKAELQLVNRDTHVSKEPYHAAITSSLQEVDRLINLTSRLLQLTTPQTFRSVDHASALLATRKASQVLQVKIDAKKLSVIHPSHDYSVAIHLHDLVEIVTIILDNAIKFSPKYGTITISAVQKQHAVDILITDKGPGIASTDLPHIFERFYQSSKRPAQRGYGLGLAIAQKLTIEAGGKISVMSQPGKTSFKITLPCTISG